MKMDLRTTFCTPSVTAKVLAAGAILLCCVGVGGVVYATGGVKFATLHLIYLPVIVAGLVFGTAGGITGGIIAGLVLGPYMPLDTATGEVQQWGNWLYRTFFFSIVGGLAGIGADALRKQLKTQMWLSDHDVQTKLLNYTGLIKKLQQMISDTESTSRPILIVVQINHFLEIQNTFGLGFVEELRNKICERGRQLMSADIPIALIQEDRLATAFESESETRQLRTEIEAHIRKPYEVNGVPFYVDFSIGAAEFSKHAHTAEDLFQKACIAMHEAATHKRPFATYNSAVDHASRDNLMMLGLVPTAITQDQFIIWHQAKISLATGKVTGTEALLRWSHPIQGLILPANFIRQVEETALINHITKWVIQNALADESAWTARGHSMNVAINLSVRNLQNRALLETLQETTKRYSIDPQKIELEITESAVMQDVEYCGQLISRLRDHGYRVSIDDFGIGHSSFAYLKKLPICALKIDQIFIKNLAHNLSDQKIVHTIINLARSLDLEVVGEGVEDNATLHLLRDWGCDYAQGFALHKPAPYDKLITWIEAGHNNEVLQT